ncbi:hypothetical protein I41_36880 [Lacipirellula limnantheis]|uniref:Uncharacterized protein n=1 Tax=Lacipirellula limnantheis TaxID=2528024 RepID=A0A517U1H8_9BACT|nr:hypothetical protein I41_36880 [Lacipirellula limnantheis]
MAANGPDNDADALQPCAAVLSEEAAERKSWAKPERLMYVRISR